MARHIPSQEVLDYFKNTLKNDPHLSQVLDNWEYLPFAPQLVDPEFYVPFISREEWGALPAKPGASPLTKVMNIRWTYAAKEECYNIKDCSRIVRELQKANMDEGMPDIQFNFLVGAKGVIYEGRGWEWEADRDERHHNFESIHGKLKGQTVDIAYIGDMSFYGPMNDVQMGAFQFILQNLRNGRIDHMVDSIPFRERPSDYSDPNIYFDEFNVPQHVKDQIMEARRNDPEMEAARIKQEAAEAAAAKKVE